MCLIISLLQLHSATTVLPQCPLAHPLSSLLFEWRHPHAAGPSSPAPLSPYTAMAGPWRQTGDFKQVKALLDRADEGEIDPPPDTHITVVTSLVAEFLKEPQPQPQPQP